MSPSGARRSDPFKVAAVVENLVRCLRCCRVCPGRLRDVGRYQLDCAMSDPLARQAAALAAVDRLIEIARNAIQARQDRWRIHNVSPYTDSLLLAYAGEWDDGGNALSLGTLDVKQAQRAHIVANDPKTTLAQLEGRRRILQRHEPVKHDAKRLGWVYWSCAACGKPPPCEDWRDAAAGLPLDQATEE